jgi:hypothetical protein
LESAQQWGQNLQCPLCPLSLVDFDNPSTFWQKSFVSSWVMGHGFKTIQSIVLMMFLFTCLANWWYAYILKPLVIFYSLSMPYKFLAMTLGTKTHFFFTILLIFATMCFCFFDIPYTCFNVTSSSLQVLYMILPIALVKFSVVQHSLVGFRL